MTLYKKILPVVVLFLTINHSCYSQQDSSTYRKIVQSIESARKIYAPDKRTKLIELKHADIIQKKYSIQTTESIATEYLQKEFKQQGIEVEFIQLPDETVGDTKIGVVNLSVANLRTQPSHSAEMATQVLLGTRVDILQKSGGDFRVRTPEGYIAWVPTSSISPMNQQDFELWNKREKVIYTEEFGKSLSQAAVNSLRVTDLVYGDILALDKRAGDYVQVSYPDNRKAYIPASEVEPFDEWLSSRNPTADNILASAKTMMGLPYLWGGTSVKGVDCSGFTKTSYFMNGYIIPRDASQQVLAGEKIDILDENGDFDSAKALKNLKPADLLFFAMSKGTRENPRVTHVALYLGNGEFIHAAGTVRINSMLRDAKNYDDFQTRTVVAARRYLGSGDSQIQEIAKSNYYTN
ncbi:C40 family peptidase [Sphingobacterium hungaricum]|uniref:Hydrolase n=1 Tax=Sphingobacterium hungaricum TaxID=2082723 RepID=A0A928UWS7_9SPHI|nr:C40 family peptidase [Sphingobacterium hungaricum]MBE8714736.1 hydrolase [Sphingobacterium hungaricum]